MIVFKQSLIDGNLNHVLAVFVKLVYRTLTTCRDSGKIKLGWFNYLGIIKKTQICCGTGLDGLIDFYSLLNWGDWELIDSLGFCLVVEPNFVDNPLQEPAFFISFHVRFSLIQEKKLRIRTYMILVFALILTFILVL